MSLLVIDEQHWVQEDTGPFYAGNISIAFIAAAKSRELALYLAARRNSHAEDYVLSLFESAEKSEFLDFLGRTENAAADYHGFTERHHQYSAWARLGARILELAINRGFYEEANAMIDRIWKNRSARSVLCR